MNISTMGATLWLSVHSRHVKLKKCEVFLKKFLSDLIFNAKPKFKQELQGSAKQFKYLLFG